jgi:Tol biopolymer transport system component
MKWLKGVKMRLVLVGIVAAIAIGGGPAKGDFTFGEPVNLGPLVNTSYDEVVGCFSADGLTMYLSSADRPGTTLNWDIWVSTRDTIDDEWAAPVNLGSPVNIGWMEMIGSISSNGLQLYFHTWEDRPGGYGDRDIWVASRETTEDSWGEPTNLGSPINSSFYDGAPNITPDGLELYFGSSRPGGYGSTDIWVSRRATINDSWAEPINLDPVVNSSASESFPCLSDDGRLLFFNEDAYPIRPGGYGDSDIWMTRRANVSDPWGTPVNLGPIINSPNHDGQAVLSNDGSTLYFSSARSGGLGRNTSDIYKAQIIPIVDFNGDGIVDSVDICILVDHWGTDNSLCDIGPMPWGDGIVDVQDLIILAEHLFEEAPLVGYWKMDETEGSIAYDSSGDHHATLYGNPVWQPAEGKIDGALQFDGIDDYANAGFVLNPKIGPFSAYAWIKGGTPGQVIISQTDGTGFGGTWLGIDQSDGKLFTNLMYFELVSESVITDGRWHHVGIVWDGSRRSLYVDEEEVARDASDMTVIQSTGDLYLGAGKNLDEGTFFSGLIDDVRIYNRAVHP